MKSKIWIRILTSLVVIGGLDGAAGTAAAQGCSNATLTGTYGIQMQGTSSDMGGGTQSVIGIVLRTYDGMGTFTQTDNIKGSVTGITPDRPGSGTYQVNADCSGSTQFEPAPGVSIMEKIVVVEGGAQIWSIVTTPADSMVTTVQKKTGVPPPVVPPVIPCPGSDPFVEIPGLVGECINGGWVPRNIGGGD
jgi:hypothetical protein